MLGKHVEEDLLELYALKRLQPEEEDRVDDHLFLCEECRQRLVETERYIMGFRLAARQLDLQQKEQPRISLRERFWEAVSPRRGMAALAACAGLAVILVVAQPDRQAVPYQDVTLRATRGVEAAPALSKGPVRLRLHLDVTGLPLAGDSGVITVTGGGGEELSRETGKVSSTGELIAALKKPLPRGSYFVRLAAASGQGRVLREYQLEVE